MCEFITHSRAETVALGRRMAGVLQPGALIAYTGGLGAGKTAFTEGLAEGDELVVFEKVLDSAGNVVATHEDIDSAEQSVVVDNPDTPEVPEEPYAKTGADAPDATGYAVAAGIALAAAAGAGGVLAYRKRKTAGASKDAAAEEPAEEPEE